MKKLSLFTLIIIISNIFLACKPNENTEQRRFDSNMTELENRSKRYPNLRKFFKEIVTEAAVKWDNVLKIQEKDKRALEMAQVNKFITGNRIYSSITTFESRIETIRYKIRDINRISPMGRPTLTRQIIEQARTLSIKADRDISRIINEVETNPFGQEMSSFQDITRVNDAMWEIERSLQAALSDVERRLREDSDRQRDLEGKSSSRPLSTAPKR